MHLPKRDYLSLAGRDPSRRAFLRMGALSLAGLALSPWRRSMPYQQVSALPNFPQAERLGRVVCASGTGCNIELKARPDLDSQTVKKVAEDEVLPWLGEVTSLKPSYVFTNQRWVETPEGFIYGPYFQPVKNLSNQPVSGLPRTSLGQGMWVEVTVPYVDAVLANEASPNSWVRSRQELFLPLRLVYSQVFWVDQIRTDDQGQVQYRVNPNYYGGLDMLWAAAEAFRPITEEDIAPIHPDAGGKRVEVNIPYQTLSCYEGNEEVYFCRVATGARFDMYGQVVDKWATPVGEHHVSRKFISLQMAGGTTGAGYDLPGIGWVVIFATGGVAIHSTFWHNNYGDPMSHGCINVAPEDARWIFRWTQPGVTYDPGMLDVTQTGQTGTSVQVRE